MIVYNISMSRIRKQKKNTNIKKTLMGGVIAGAAIAVPAITVAAGIGKIDPNQIDYAAEYHSGDIIVVTDTSSITTQEEINNRYGGSWTFYKAEQLNEINLIVSSFNSSIFNSIPTITANFKMFYTDNELIIKGYVPTKSVTITKQTNFFTFSNAPTSRILTPDFYTTCIYISGGGSTGVEVYQGCQWMTNAVGSSYWMPTVNNVTYIMFDITIPLSNYTTPQLNSKNYWCKQ